MLNTHERESERLDVFLKHESFNAPVERTVETSANFFADPSRLPSKLRDGNFCEGHKKRNVEIIDDVSEFEFSPAYAHHSLRRTPTSSHTDPLTVSTHGHEPSTPDLNSEMGESQSLDQEANRDARSTLADASAAPANNV